MYYLVQENVFKEENYDNLIIALDRLKLDYEIVSVKPFIEEFEFKTERKDIFPFGSLKMARLSEKYKWYPGSQMNSNHDFLVYEKYYKENLLNYDSKIIRFGDNNFFNKEIFFARPTKDTKVFTGKIFDMEEWRSFRDNALTNGHSTILDENTAIQISTVKKLYNEIRFWIVGGKIITASQYRLGNRLVLSDIVSEAAYYYCKSMVEIFQLNEAFVMDIALTEKGYKIIECGCINCAGFYRADMQRVLIALEDYFNPKGFECYPEYYEFKN